MFQLTYLLVYDLEFTTPCWSATLTNLGGGGGKVPFAPSIRQCELAAT